MATKKFPSELSERSIVLPTDKLLIHNITTGATEFTSASGLFAAFKIAVLGDNIGIGTIAPAEKVDIAGSTNISDGNAYKIGVAGFGHITGVGVYVAVYKSAASGTLGANSMDAITVLQESGNVGIETTTPSEKLHVNGNIYAASGVSALSFTDRTPFYEGDALSELKGVKGFNGKIDHESLPSFARAVKITEVYADKTVIKKGKEVVEKIKVGENVSDERDLGAMISILTKAVQQLTVRIEELEK